MLFLRIYFYLCTTTKLQHQIFLPLMKSSLLLIAGRLLLAFFLQSLAFSASASSALSKLDLKSLDSCLSARHDIDAKYESRIRRMKQQLSVAGKDYHQRKVLLKDIARSYFYYQFDSALVYIKQGYKEAVANGDSRASTSILLSEARLLAYGGFYNNAEDIIMSVDYNSLPTDALRYDYAIAAYWTYVFWSAFTMDDEFSSRLDSLRMHYLNLAIRYERRGSAQWYYLKGERSYFAGEAPSTSLRLYQEALRQCGSYGQLYSCISFAIARSYSQMHNDNLYGQYLLKSSRSDILSSVKENAALQELAMYIFNKDNDKATLAHQYLLDAMDDAAFYNNKLRKLEISNRLPPIVNAYQKQLQEQHKRRTAFFIVFIILATGILVLYLLSRRRNAQLHLSQKLLEHKNLQLNTANTQLQEANGELLRLNGLLKESGRKREEYLRVFVDICAYTLDRISSYRNLVKLKIKANQTKDLLRTLNSDRIVSSDMNKFMLQFDKAFLGLYPDFPSEFNSLLSPGYTVELNKDGTMPTGLRIFALIRLGVTESSEIATLLFYSPHTIYNYRSAIKSHAIDKNHFEDNVRQLCKQ